MACAPRTHPTDCWSCYLSLCPQPLSTASACPLYIVKDQEGPGRKKGKECTSHRSGLGYNPTALLPREPCLELVVVIHAWISAQGKLRQAGSRVQCQPWLQSKILSQNKVGKGKQNKTKSQTNQPTNQSSQQNAFKPHRWLVSEQHLHRVPKIPTHSLIHPLTSLI